MLYPRFSNGQFTRLALLAFSHPPYSFGHFIPFLLYPPCFTHRNSNGYIVYPLALLILVYPPHSNGHFTHMLYPLSFTHLILIDTLSTMFFHSFLYPHCFTHIFSMDTLLTLHYQLGFNHLIIWDTLPPCFTHLILMDTLPTWLFPSSYTHPILMDTLLTLLYPLSVTLFPIHTFIPWVAA